MRIGHLGAYNRNLGDNIAIFSVRNSFEKYIKNIDWISMDISLFFDINNNSDASIRILESFNLDCLIVGGGGLIECQGFTHTETEYKLPFTSYVLERLDFPVIFFSIGINYFRGSEGFTAKAFDNINGLINASAFFSLRNDGSLDIAKKEGFKHEKICELPDPGLILNYEKFAFCHKINQIVLEPAFNATDSINHERYLGMKNIDLLNKISNLYAMPILPHTPKDYKLSGKYLVNRKDIVSFVDYKNISNSIKYYLDLDAVIAMRGHGQLISIGMNVPGLYLATQDKVSDFSMKNGFHDYSIDIREPYWYRRLNEKIILILNDADYLDRWYQIRELRIKEWRKVFDNATKQIVSTILVSE